MEHQLEAWLKTYRADSVLSPATWSDLPKDCKVRLDNYARDEAVRRADEFVRDGHLDLDRQDAIRQLVDSMAQCWMLPAGEIRRFVEDYLDEQEAQAGFEFDKLTTRIFRRRSSATWKDLLDMVDYKREPKIISIVSRELDIDRRKNTDRTAFLAAWRAAFDTWSLAEAKDAVNEMVDLVKPDATGATEIPLREILPLIKHRGGSGWAKALELELEVGVETAVREDLIRMLKRYSLIVKREGAARSISPTPQRSEHGTSFMPVPDETVTRAEALVSEEETQVEPKISEKPVEPEPKIVVVEETEDVEETDLVEDEIAASVEEEADEENLAEEADVDEADLDAAEALFGAGENPAVEEAPSVSEEVLPQDRAEEEIVADEETTEETPEIEDKVEQAESEVKQQAPVKEKPTRLKDVFSPSPVKDKRDRFKNIRSGSLRDKVVNEMYGGDATLLDVFLAKLSGAPDWNRAKQFIANEFFRCKIDLHSDLGETLFLELKESLSD